MGNNIQDRIEKIAESVKQQQVIIGNVGREPELNYTKNGRAVLSFSLAVNHGFKNKDDQFVVETAWVKVSLWGEDAERVNSAVDEHGEPRLAKGMSVMVILESPIKSRAYVANDGNAKVSFEAHIQRGSSLRCTDWLMDKPAYTGRQNEEPDDMPSEINDIPF